LVVDDALGPRGVALAESEELGHRDPAGDSRNSPDVIAVMASGAAKGRLQFATTLGNPPTGMSPSDVLCSGLETDLNSHAGTNIARSDDPAKHGTDYVFDLGEVNRTITRGAFRLKAGAAPTPTGDRSCDCR
jgi:hypothetical protein